MWHSQKHAKPTRQKLSNPRMNKAELLSRRTLAALACCAVLTAGSGVAGAEVTFNGLSERQEANARALVRLVSAECQTNRWRVERLFRDADEDLERSLQALGYYDATIIKTLTWDEDCWHAEFEVSTGEPVRLRQIDVQVDGQEPDDSWLPDAVGDLQPIEGAILNHGDYERLKTAVLNAAANKGFFDAAFTRREVIVDPDSLSADLHLHLTSGPRYRFGEVSFTDGILREDLLEKYTDIEEGDYFDAEAIASLHDALNGSSYFSSVQIRTDRADEAALVAPVDVALTPGIRRSYSVGAGFATDTGPQGRLGYINRRVNDRGHQFEARAFVSDTNSELTGQYRWPVRNPRTDWASIIGGAQHEDTETSENDTYKIGYVRTQSLSENWLWSRSVDYSYEDFAIGDQDEVSRLLIFGVNFESAIGREISRSAGGRRINFNLRGASESVASDTSFLQFMATTRWLWSLTDKTRLFLRGRLGTTIKDNLADLPVSVRFFTGGDRSVRGYDYESLGPTDDNGAVIGGSHLIEASIEFDRMLTENWSIAAFADTGSAFSSSPEFSSGIGLGIRWYSPVGPVRIDLAHPLDDPDRDFRFHIVLGPDL